MLNHRIESTGAPILGIYVGENSDDFKKLSEIFLGQRWGVSRVETWEEAVATDLYKRATHFLYEHTPHGHDWIQALEAINALPGSPSFILASRTGDEQLWAEVLTRGGYDLLLKPFDAVEVLRVIRSAWWYSHRQLLRPSALAF